MQSLFTILVILLNVNANKRSSPDIIKLGLVDPEEAIPAFLNEPEKFRLIEVLLSQDELSQYLDGHIPGAVFVTLLATFHFDQSDRLCQGLFSIEGFKNNLDEMKLGVGDHIVLYDDFSRGPGILSARMFWLLRLFGYDKVSILSGGKEAFLNMTNIKLEKGMEQRNARFPDGFENYESPNPPIEPNIRRELYRNTMDVIANIRSQEYQLIDSRVHSEFMYSMSKSGKSRSFFNLNHVPGAKNVPFPHLMDLKRRRFQTLEEILKVYHSNGVDPYLPSIAMCNCGLTASAVLITLHELGNRNVSLYCGSWLNFVSLFDSEVSKWNKCPRYD